MTMFANVRSAYAKRAAYRRLRHEISTMRRETAIDLGLFPEDAEKIAAEAIYGK